MTKTAEKPQTPKKNTYRLLRGRHVEKVGEVAGKPVLKTYQADRRTDTYPLIETDKDLSIFNGKGVAPKFEVVKEAAAPVYVDPTVRRPGETMQAYLVRLAEFQNQAKSSIDAAVKSVDGMSLDELKEFADAEEIDLKGAKTVDEMRKTVKAALRG